MVPPPPETSLPTMLPTTTVSPLALEPVEVTDRFRIASISKILTGTVTLQLVDAGDLSLDEPVAPRLAEHLGIGLTGQAVETVTVRQLLSHTSGFGPFERTFFGHGVESCREAAIRGFAVGLDSTPGTTYRYSNMNFCVLGQLIEAVTGEPYEDAVRELLLEPLGIGGMRMAGTFDVRPDEVVHPSFPGRNYMETLGGAGAWVATPAEIVRVVDSLDNAKPGWHPLPGELASMMRRPVPGITYHDPLWQWYGLATIAYADQSWGHTGTVENTHAVVRHRPDGMTWALFVSGNHPEDSDDLARMFQEALDQSGIDAPAPTTSTTTTTSTTSTSSTSTTVPAGVVGPIAVEPLGTLPD
jgi:D-alanyl-D-alanine carboxypeptidase